MTVETYTIGTDGLDDYATLPLWQTDQVQNLVTAGITEMRAQLGDDYASGWSMQGFDVSSSWGTDATHKIYIEPQSGEGHGGVEGGGVYISNSTSSGPFYCWKISAANVEVIEMEFEDDQVYYTCHLNGANNVEFKRIIINRINRGTDSNGAFHFIGVNADCKVLSSLVKSDQAVPFRFHFNSSSTMQIENNTVIQTHATNHLIEFSSGAFNLSPTIENNHWHGDNLYTTTPTGASNSSYNSFRSGIDATFGTNAVTGVVETTGTDFVNFGTGDYTPADGGKLDNAGTTISAATDLANATWVTSDIGCLVAEVAGGGSSVSPSGIQTPGRQYAAVASSKLGGVLQ